MCLFMSQTSLGWKAPYSSASVIGIRGAQIAVTLPVREAMDIRDSADRSIERVSRSQSGPSAEWPPDFGWPKT
jgi:hypothetical protein